MLREARTDELMFSWDVGPSVDGDAGNYWSEKYVFAMNRQNISWDFAKFKLFITITKQKYYH